MRYREFNLTEDELFELKMSPTNLARMAKNIDALAGLEFELVVPDFEGEPDYDNVDPEPDYDMDERFPVGRGWRREVIDFFRGGDSPNSTGYIERQLADLEENFYGWLEDKIDMYMSSDEGQQRGMEIAADNVSRDEYDSDEEYQTALVAYIDDNSDDIREQLEQEFRDDLDSHWERYLEDENLTTMSEFGSAYNLDWPYWIYPEPDSGGADIDAVAESFSDAIGRPVTVSKSYHGATRRAGHYAVEPDSSIEGDDGESGLEFVSPPLPIPEMIEDIGKVAKWASQIGAYTNSSTGLHMNVSVPNIEDLDYVKLAMFLGDNYILEQFGREGNTYCKSALEKIKSTARANPDRVDEMLRQFQNGLNDLASKMIHTGSTEKYTSINRQSNRVEFRSPGGDWLSEFDSNPDKIKNTLLRTVVALDVASDPTAYRQEYYKKLYKTLSQGSQDTSIEYFAKYAAGELPKQALKSFIRQIQTQREVKKQQPDSGKQYWWNVAVGGQRIEVVATSQEEAWKKALDERQEWWRYEIGQADIKPLRPYEETPASSRDQRFAGYWEIVDRNTDQIVHFFSAAGMDDPRSVAEAERRAAEWQQQTGFDDPYYVRPLMRASDESPRQQPVAGSTQDLQRQRLAAQMPRLEIEDGNWEIYSISSGNGIYRFVANTEEEAVRAFNIWQDTIRAPGLPREGFNLRTVQPIRARTGEPVPAGSAGQQTYRVTYAIMDNQGTSMHDTSVQARNADAAMAQVRQALQARGQTPEYISADPLISTSTPAQGTESLPPGNTRWLVLDQNDREVYSFVHRSNQGEANVYAANWLRQNGMLGRGEYMVVPAR